MATVLVYRWLSPLPSRKRLRGAVTVPVQEEMLTDQFIFAPLPSWYTSSERGEDHFQVATYLRDVIWEVRAASEDFTESLENVANCQELVTRVFEALLVIESVQIPGVPKCVMCESPVAVHETPRSANPAGGENMLRYPILDGPSGGQFWILDEILVYPSWRVHSPPRLCAFHTDEFSFAFSSVMFGCVRIPQRPERSVSV